MEKIIDFDTFIANFVPREPEYEAIFDDSGVVISVRPKGISEQVKNKVDIDLDIVEQIHAGTLHLHNCFVDLDSGEIEITRKEYLKKIDDILHRIPHLDFFDKSQSIDVKIIYDRKKSKVTFSMTEKLKTKKMRWSGDTILSFYFTDYNDPHLLFDKIDITIDELYKKDRMLKLEIDQRFSIYTRRLLKNYVLEEKK